MEAREDTTAARAILRRIGAYFSGLSVPGLFGAGLFFSLSLAPSLIPRDPVFQGALSGFSAAAGYWLGQAVAWCWRFLEFPVPDGRRARAGATVLLVAALGLVARGLWLSTEWQDELRQFLGLETMEHIYTPVVVLVALPVALVLRECGRGFALTVRAISRPLDRILPRRVSLVLGVTLAATAIGFVASGTLLRAALDSLDAMFLAIDEAIPDHQARPASPLVTGGPDSLVAWEDLGRQGREFVTSGPDDAEIAQFAGGAARRPIRVYVGLGAAETPGERARLALEELKRTGAFERAVLVIATPTGTGWIDEEAVDPLEFLHRGDTAIVALQYSYLTSYVSLMVEPLSSKESATALFETVYAHWTTLPRDARPRLYLHGLSLGSYGSEQSMSLFNVLGDLIHGAVWSGPSFRNPNWAAFTRDRRPGSPFWQPRVADGALVRFTNQQNALDVPGARWGPVRLVYLQYASDPVTFFSPDIFLREPAWLTGERGPDVSPAFEWVPVVTGLQVAFDMVGASGLGPGLGHLYAADDYIDAWVAVTAPEGWGEADLARLKARFER